MGRENEKLFHKRLKLWSTWAWRPSSRLSSTMTVPYSVVWCGKALWGASTFCATTQKPGGHQSGLFFQHITEKDVQVEKVTGPESLKSKDTGYCVLNAFRTLVIPNKNPSVFLLKKNEESMYYSFISDPTKKLYHHMFARIWKILQRKRNLKKKSHSLGQQGNGGIFL